MPPLPLSLFPAGWRAVVAGQSAGSFEGHPDTCPTTGLVRRTGCVFGRNRIASWSWASFLCDIPVLCPMSSKKLHLRLAKKLYRYW